MQEWIHGELRGRYYTDSGCVRTYVCSSGNTHVFKCGHHSCNSLCGCVYTHRQNCPLPPKCSRTLHHWSHIEWGLVKTQVWHCTSSAHDLCDVTNNTTFTGPQPEYVPLACTGDSIPSCSASAWTRQWLQSKHTLSEVYSSKFAIYTTVSNLVFTCVIATTYGTSSSRADLITEAAIFQGYFPISVSNPNLIIIVHIIHENLT